MGSDIKAQLYGNKPTNYYCNTRFDLVNLVEGVEHSILDVGCGSGQTGALLKATGKARSVVGIELNEEVGTKARAALDEVICGDIEVLDLSLFRQRFDYVIFGDVLEHTLNPWNVLRKTTWMLTASGIVLASLPNIRHWTILRQVAFGGEWKYRIDGILDKTHLRFFTRKSAISMFEETGFKVVATVPFFTGRRSRWGGKLAGDFAAEFLAQRWLFKTRLTDSAGQAHGTP